MPRAKKGPTVKEDENALLGYLLNSLWALGFQISEPNLAPAFYIAVVRY